ncbi:acyltransferase [Streptomyces platensis]|uniref:acyltransferase n=1 Tax=Streptomyces platensis TaxID=58346 RepID=UPI0036B4A32D
MMSTEEILRLTVAAIMSRTGETNTDVAASIGQARSQVSRKQRGQAHWSLADVDNLAAHWGMPVLDLLAGPLHAAQKLPADRLVAGARAQTLLPIADPSTSKKPAKKRATPKPTAAAPAPVAAAAPPAPLIPDRTESGGLVEAELAPCILCGVPVTARADGRPQHAYGVCGTAAPSAAAEQQPEAVEVIRAKSSTGRAPRGSGYAADYLVQQITDAVQDVLHETGGDIDAALPALIKRAIPDVMDLFNRSRVGGAYEHSEFPPTQDVLKKRSQKESDAIWEGRPKWRNPELAAAAKQGESIQVSVLDMNASYLSAMKCWLPIGRLMESTSGEHDRTKSGVHLITPPEWDHPHLPNPLGARQEPGELWVGEETLRLLLHCSRKDLCDPPVIHRALVSGGTEGLLEKLRRALAEARRTALAEDDELTKEYVKAMYSKFVSTIGESSSNRALRRPEWMHIIRAKSFANLWMKAHRAHESGLTVAEVTATDELHVVGDWRAATITDRHGKTKPAFLEGRDLSEVKEKKVYTLGVRR